MVLHSILRQSRNSGFTIIEIIITIAILIIILSFGLFISFDFYKNYSFRSERNIIISVLQKARDQSLNNIDQTSHGVHFEANPNLKYTIFEGSSYDQDNQNNLVVNASYGISITSLILPFDVIFDQLSGVSSDEIITIYDGFKSYNITVNSEGKID